MSIDPGEITLHPASAGAADVAVVVPAYNRRTATVRTLESVRAQTLAPCAVIVVDDGSTDGTAAHVSRWADEAWPGAPLRVHRQTNRGAAAARNEGLARVPLAARYIAFLDSDDVWPRDFLSRTRAAFEVGQVLVAVSVDQVFVGRERGARSLKGMGAAWMLRHGAGIGSATLISRDALGARPWNEALRSGADFELFLNLTLKAPWGHLTGEPVQMHRGQPAEGETDNLSGSSPLNAIAWARIAQDFVDAHAARLPASPGWTRRAALHWWQRAQVRLAGAQHWQEAAEAARHSLAHLEALARQGAKHNELENKGDPRHVGSR